MTDPVDPPSEDVAPAGAHHGDRAAWHPGGPARPELTDCADEPIHIPGSIQPFGALIGFDEATRELRIVSANLADHLGVAPGVALASSLDEVLGAAAADVDAALASLGVGRLDLDAVSGRRSALAGSVSRSDGLALVEIEPRVVDDDTLGALWHATMALHGATSVVAAAAAAARAVREITGFDRVIVYRFDREWNGEVLAEARDERLRTFLGLRFPSTDIPAQARALYERNLVRFIGDVDYAPVPLLVGRRPAPWPVDLSDAVLRSVSPIHLEYLRNMGVTASMSISLLSEGRLWGLVACHHYSGPLVPPGAARAASLQIGQVFGLRVHDLQNADRRARSLDLFAVSDDLAQEFAGQDHGRVTDVLVSRSSDIMKLAGASGLVVRFEGVEAARVGLCPAPEVIDRVVARISPDGDPHWSSDRLHADLGIAEPPVAGALALSLSGDRDDVLVWFRPEVVEVVEWAGDPYAKERAAEQPGIRLSPRRSFDTWRETVRGRSAAWESAELAAALRFGRHLGGALRRRDREAHALATALQTAMQPDRLPLLRGVELDAYYRPDGAGRVGGDWYDAFEVDGSLVVVLGDVAGHGLTAAAAMTQVRNAARAHLFHEPDAAEVLSRLSDFVEQALPDDTISALIGVLDRAAGTLRWASAGHLMPRVRRADGSVHRLEGAVGPILGLRRTRYAQTTSSVREGDLLVMFSDGLVERRTRPIDAGIADLEHAMAVHPTTDLTGYGARLARLVAEDLSEDDVTVLAVRLGMLR